MKSQLTENKNYKLRTFFDELSDYGFLAEYILQNLNPIMKTNKFFRDDILKKLMNSNNDPPEFIDFILLEHLSDSLDYFIERARIWTNENQ